MDDLPCGSRRSVAWRGTIECRSQFSVADDLDRPSSGFCPCAAGDGRIADQEFAEYRASGLRFRDSQPICTAPESTCRRLPARKTRRTAPEAGVAVGDNSWNAEGGVGHV